MAGTRSACFVYLALDTTRLWETYCVVYVLPVYRGWIIPLVWKVMDHPSALVFLKRSLSGRRVYLLMDRGFVHRDLMRWVKDTPEWHFRIRYKSGVGLCQWDGDAFWPLSWHYARIVWDWVRRTSRRRQPRRRQWIKELLIRYQPLLDAPESTALGL